MNEDIMQKEFNKIIKNKFNIYNGLFLNLPFSSVTNIGVLIPLLQQVAKKGLEEGNDPQDILNTFFALHANIHDEKDRIDFMFKVIQYVERQVVVFDSVEDAGYTQMIELGNSLTLKDFFHLSETRNKTHLVHEKFSSCSARIVFTAHPTQFYPPMVLDIIAQLRAMINVNDINGIDLTLQQLGMTSFINATKPTPFDEAQNIIYFFRHVYYEALTDLYQNIKHSIPSDDFNNHDLVKLGFWPGGDRDGNPFVTSDITVQVADELRMTLMKCYYNDIKKLSKKLTFKDVESIINELRSAIYPTMFYRDKTIRFEDIINRLNKVRNLLVSRYNSLYLEELERFIDKVKIFKTHFATLDIRQDHSIHKKTIQEIFLQEGIIENDLEELSKEELKDILLHKDIQVLPEQFSDPLIKDTIKTFLEMKNIQAKNGEDVSNRYIISNSEDIFSVLFVFALFRFCGWDINNLTYDIIPLFETMNGMANAEDVMNELFATPEYRSHVERRSEKHTIMLGFSDGTKDGGYLQANWSIFKTKETLTRVCDNHGVKAIFFDGRGGPPARGGGKTHQFYASQTREIANHEIQLTIQGQTISSKYGTKQHFLHNTEQLLAATLANTLFAEDHVISPEHRAMIEELANTSYGVYNELKHHEKFIPYLEAKSTLKYYAKANIGSRPAKRGDKKKLELKDLRAISFVGSWAQLKQNVPGYYGVGSAIKQMVDQGRLEDLKVLYRQVPFFKTLISNSMMSLSKSYFELTRYIEKDPVFGDFWKILYEEFKLTKEMTLLITGYETLMEKEPINRNSIEIREQLVLPLLIVQQYALQQIEKNSENTEVYEKMIERSLYGNINASRNSA